MGVYRKKLDIIADILNVVSESAKKTRIMYQANLSYNVLQKYVAELLEASLMRFHEDRQCYVITEKGLEFLKNYDDYCRSKRFFEKHQNETRSKKDRLSELCSV